MSEREARRNDQTPQPGPPSGGASGGQLNIARQSAMDLHSAGAAAISRALSKNSEAFTASSKQEGGQ